MKILLQRKDSNMTKEIKIIVEAHKKFTKERDWDQFQNPKNLSIALSVEASELAEIFMWLTEKQSNNLNKKQLQAASEEIADIFIYLLRISDMLGVDLFKSTGEKMNMNIDKYSIEKGKFLAQGLITE
jgi:dCTP diphosphatase